MSNILRLSSVQNLQKSVLLNIFDISLRYYLEILVSICNTVITTCQSYLILCCPLQVDWETSSTCSWLTQTHQVKRVTATMKRRRWRDWSACPSRRRMPICACPSGITCSVSTRERFTSSRGRRQREGRSCGQSAAIRATGGGRGEFYCHIRQSYIR